MVSHRVHIPEHVGSIPTPAIMIEDTPLYFFGLTHVWVVINGVVSEVHAWE